MNVWKKIAVAGGALAGLAAVLMFIGLGVEGSGLLVLSLSTSFIAGLLLIIALVGRLSSRYRQRRIEA